MAGLSLKERLAARAAAASAGSVGTILQDMTTPKATPTAEAKATPVEAKTSAEATALKMEAILDSPIEGSILVEAQQTIEDIIPRIRNLSNIETGETLKHEMDLLKASLMANPAAVSLMLPTDVGHLVEALRRIVGEAIVTASTKPTRGKKKEVSKRLTAEDLAEMDDL